MSTRQELWWFPGLESAFRTVYPSSWNHLEGDSIETRTSTERQQQPAQTYEAKMAALLSKRLEEKASLDDLTEQIRRMQVFARRKKRNLAEMDAKLMPHQNAAKLKEAVG